MNTNIFKTSDLIVSQYQRTLTWCLKTRFNNLTFHQTEINLNKRRRKHISPNQLVNNFVLFALYTFNIALLWIIYSFCRRRAEIVQNNMSWYRQEKKLTKRASTGKIAQKYIYFNYNNQSRGTISCELQSVEKVDISWKNIDSEHVVCKINCFVIINL